MTDAPQSPRRRHILSSINRDEPTQRPRRQRSKSRSPRGDSPLPKTEGGHAKDDNVDEDGDTTRPRRTRLKLKDHRSRRRSRSRHDDDSHQSSRRHHRRRRRHRSPTPPNPHEPAPLDPDAAFRESLFDAMADDEGAAYWQGVYGQPVHIYSDTKAGPAGELEQMTEEEYAAHVRQKMWEKTHAGLLEERARREEQRKRKKQEDEQGRKLRDDMERSLRRGEERRQKRQWAERWQTYTEAWAKWDGTPETLPWPLEQGRRAEIGETDVRVFFIHGLGLEDIGERAFVARLKEERVRWHPDKMQQRLGGQVQGDIMKDVTAIFQIIDKLWTDSRPKT